MIGWRWIDQPATPLYARFLYLEIIKLFFSKRDGLYFFFYDHHKKNQTNKLGPLRVEAGKQMYCFSLRKKQTLREKGKEKEIKKERLRGEKVRKISYLPLQNLKI